MALVPAAVFMLIIQINRAITFISKMSKKYTLLTVAFTAIAGNMMAQKTDVSVLCLDGTAYTVKMTEIERIEIEQGAVNVIPVTGETQTYQMSVIDKIAFIGGDNGIHTATDKTTEISFSVSGSTIIVSGVTDGTAVELYNMAGQTVSSTISRNGRAEIDTSRYAAGAYVIKAGRTAQKVTKK